MSPEELAMNHGAARRVAIIGGSRIPFCRSQTAYRHCSNQQLMTAALQALVAKYSLQGERLGDVALGAVLKHSRDFNLARESVLDSGLAPQTPAVDLQRACGTGLEGIIMVANKIALGQIEAGIGGGTDTTSDPPVAVSDGLRRIAMDSFRGRSTGERVQPWLGLRPRHLKPEFPGTGEPRTRLSMGESMEITAKAWGISRERQDALAMASHQKAAAAWDSGFYDDLVVAFEGAEQDNNVRRDTSMQRLAKLRPAFDRSPRGTLTAGNSTPLTDGAACVLVTSEEWAAARGLKPLAWLTHAKVAAVDFVADEGLLMAPAYAVSEMLRDADLGLGDFDFYEIHEAFAAQALATMAAWESPGFCRERLGRDTPLGAIDRSRLNIKGGSVAMGHPFAATGARITATLAKILAENRGGRGLISICTAGGMGVTAILEAAE
jgi:acetyl-CoA C-acetyltransferase